jgi:hypothetical protein
MDSKGWEMIDSEKTNPLRQLRDGFGEGGVLKVDEGYELRAEGVEARVRQTPGHSMRRHQDRTQNLSRIRVTYGIMRSQINNKIKKISTIYTSM